MARTPYPRGKKKICYARTGKDAAAGDDVLRPASVAAIVRDAGFDFVDGLIHERDRALAMSALVGSRVIQIRARLTEIRQSRLHLRLGRAELTCDECESENE